MAVDRQGNVYVYNDGTNTVSRYDSNGNPAPFSALGTNTIDGHGFGEDCPNTPDDCDRVPSNGFGPSPDSSQGGNSLRGQVAVDNSDGPASGYIYVTNPAGGPPLRVGSPGTAGATEVFDPTGTYLGEIDKSVDGPNASGPGGGQVSVDSNGHVYVFWTVNPSVLDEFVPIDGNPAHDVFRGQLYTADSGYPAETAVGDNPYTYYDGFSGLPWHKVDHLEYTAAHKPFTNPFDVPLPSGEMLFENGGYDAEYNVDQRSLSIDPATHDVYISPESNGYGRIRQFDQNNRPIGPIFGLPYTGEIWKVAIDDTSGSTRGTVYAQGSGHNQDQIAVFSPPIPLPDIEYGSSSVLHTTAHLTANVKLNGGPEVTRCELEWGTTIGYGNTPAYERKPVPCSAPLPYTTDQQVAADISKLTVEQEFHYRFVVETANGVERGRNQNATPHAVISAQTKPATDVTKTTATLHGALDPDGHPTTYFFEYGGTESYGQKTPERSASEGSGIEDLPGEPVVSLQPGRLYHVRLVARNDLGTTYGPDLELQIPDAPSVFALRTSNLTETSADLQAKVNPLGYDTRYRFEWGSSEAYGDSTEEFDLGDGIAPEDVETHLGDLQPGVTYHFRVVATNQWGTTAGPDTTFSFLPPVCPNAHVRQQVGAGYLPDCRAYELVSPENTEGTQILPGESPMHFFDTNPGAGFADLMATQQYAQNSLGLATSPSRFSYYASGSGMGGADAPNTVGDLYVATRTDHDWESRYMGVPGDRYIGGGNPQCSVTLDQCLEYPMLADKEGNPNRRDNTPLLTDSATGQAIGRLPSNSATVPDRHEFTGEGRASGDFSHYAFSSLDQLFAVGGTTVEPGSVYDNNTRTDTVQVASKLPNGEPIPSEPGANQGPEPNPDYLEVPALSTDGSHVLIGARSGARCLGTSHCLNEARSLHLYMRVDGATTYDVSRGHAVFLQGITEDGSTVYFTTAQSLSPQDTDSSVDLYRWTEADDSVEVISQGNGQGNSDDCSATWTDQCDIQPLSTCTAAWNFQCYYEHKAGASRPFMSERPDIDTGIARTDGAILFESPEQLDGANPGLAQERNLYLFRNGHVQYVTTFDPGSGTERFNISPDGAHVAFLTDSRLTAYDNNSGSEVQCGAVLNLTPGTLNTPCREMYSFDANTGRIRCVSCDPTGHSPAGDVAASASGLFMTDDGRVFFNSPDPLVAGDTNGLIDVYEFVDGRPQLISTGTGKSDLFGGYINVIALGFVFPPEHVGLESVSADGMDVYFSTFETLAPQDRNGDFVKMYDARTGGGFPFVPPALPCPAADECHGDSSAPPAPPQIGSSAALRGAAPQSRKKRSAQKHRSKRRHRNKRNHQKGHPKAGRQGR
jgi:hypothetical protein